MYQVTPYSTSRTPDDGAPFLGTQSQRSWRSWAGTVVAGTLLSLIGTGVVLAATTSAEVAQTSRIATSAAFAIAQTPSTLAQEPQPAIERTVPTASTTKTSVIAGPGIQSVATNPAVASLMTTAPVWNGDFPDPDIVVDGDTIYAYATNTLWSNVPVLVSIAGDDFVWAGDILPELPSWTSPGRVWAPSITALSDHWVLHYTTRHDESGRQCIGVATADSALGPFTDENDGPLICALDEGGAIDPSVVINDDGSIWLLWKSDGNCCNQPSIIYSQQLSTDGTALISEPVELIRNDLAWERDVVEGPSMVARNGVWHLFYAANRWDTGQYSTGRAVCASVTGPCTKVSTPWLSTNQSASGPGGMEVIELPGSNQDLAVYHGWAGPVTYESGGARSMFFSYVDWDGHLPTLTTTPDPRLEPAAGPGSALTFVDVTTADWRNDAAAWMAASGVTTGCRLHHFCPDQEMTREQQLTFLWRHVGEPESGPEAPFNDVSETSYFAEAVSWAFNTGITNGTGTKRFGTGQSVTRGQAVTFLWRHAGEPIARAAHRFVDVPSGQFFTDAVAWAAEVGITHGKAPTEFAPNAPVTRIEFAAFLSRYDAIS